MKPWQQPDELLWVKIGVYVWGALCLGAAAGMIYIIVHFVTKYW